MARTVDHPKLAGVRLLEGELYATRLHEALRWMRKNAPLYWDEEGEVWAVTLYEDVCRISRTPDVFCSSGGIRPDSPPFPYMIDLDGKEHRKRRNLVNRGFTLREVSARESRIRGVTTGLLRRAREKGRFDFVHDVAAWLPLIVIGDMLGVEEDAYDDLLRWSDDMLLGTGASDPGRMARAEQSFVEYTEYQRAVIRDRRGRPPQSDIVSILVHSEIDGERLDDEEILMESLLILIGGDETTRHVISGGVYELLRHPEEHARLLDDPGLVPIAVEEMLRWVSPIQNMARTASRDVELRGQTIQEGDKLLLLYPSANRDESVFPDPFRFDVTRQPNEHVAFGYGPHFCMGANLARIELRVFFEELLREMPDLALARDEAPPRRASNFISGIESLPVEVRG